MILNHYGLIWTIFVCHFLLAFIGVPLNKVEKSSELRPDSKQNIYIF